jgi:hypothetical protein
MNVSTAEAIGKKMGVIVTPITQTWEITYPYYPNFGGFYNSARFLYPYSKISMHS